MLGEKATENAIPLLGVLGPDGKHDKIDDDDIEAQPAVAKPAGLGTTFLLWTAINMAATIGIVFTNKAIFNDPSFKLMQTSFASFHFVCTGLTLWVVSRPSIGAFVPKRAGLVEMLPVSVKTCGCLFTYMVHSRLITDSKSYSSLSQCV